MQPQHRGGGGEGFLPPAPWPVIASPPVVPAWSAVANADRVVMRRGWAGAADGGRRALSPRRYTVKRAEVVDRLLTVEQAADRLGTSPRFIRRLIAERRIAFTRLGSVTDPRLGLDVGGGRPPHLQLSGCRHGVGEARVDPHTTLAVGDSLRRAALRPLASWQTCAERGPWTRRRSEVDLGSGRRATDVPHQSRHRANSELSESMRSRRPPP